MIYELRIYTICEGRMPNIHARFADHAIALFEKHGMHIIDFFEDINESKIYYIVEHESMQSHDDNFKAFFADPEWIRVREESEADGPIVAKVETHFLARTPYSPNKAK